MDYYELIKTYPESKPNGTRWIKREFGYLEECYCRTPYEGTPCYYFTERVLIDNPEYFKHVILE